MTKLDHALVTVLGTDESYWERGDQAWRAEGAPYGPLPESPEIQALAGFGRPAFEVLLRVARTEPADTLRFQNAVFALMYFDSLWVYRGLKAIYARVGCGQRLLLDEVCRRILARCLAQVRGDDYIEALAYVLRYPRRGRLASTLMMAELAEKVARETGRDPVCIHDMAVSDGVPMLNVALSAAERGVRVTIQASNPVINLYYGSLGGDYVVFTSQGTPLQLEINGITYPAAALPQKYAEIGRQLVGLYARGGMDSGTLLSPSVELALSKHEHTITLMEASLFRPEADLSQADIIRVSNLLVEVPGVHKGYFAREVVLNGLARLGWLAKDGAYLLVNNCLMKVEHIGLWRKDAAAGQWTRLRPGGHVVDALDGVGGIPLLKP